MNIPSTPSNKASRQEIELAQSRTEEFLFGVDAGGHIAAAAMFEDQGRPYFFHYPERYQEVFKQARAIARARGEEHFDREGSRAIHWGIRAGIERMIEANR